MNANSAANAGIQPARLQQTILVIDDDPAMRTILGFTLKAFGYVALVAGDGEEALQIAGYHPEIRLIILDVVMAGLSGKKLADQLKIKLPKAMTLSGSTFLRGTTERRSIRICLSALVLRARLSFALARRCL
jgi:CheY-like chemotaxis protein